MSAFTLFKVQQLRARAGERKGHPLCWINSCKLFFFFVNVLCVCLLPLFNSFQQVFAEHLWRARSHYYLRTNTVMFGV